MFSFLRKKRGRNPRPDSKKAPVNQLTKEAHETSHVAQEVSLAEFNSQAVEIDGQVNGKHQGVKSNGHENGNGGKILNGKALIEVRNVTKTYPSSTGEFNALKDVTFNVYPGEFLGIIGKSGAGKSTLLNMISGVDHLSSGEVVVQTNGSGRTKEFADTNGLTKTNGSSEEGKPVSVHKMTENKLALWRGRNLGIVYQSFQLLPMLNLVDNVVLPMDMSGTYRTTMSRERALELLRMLDIEEHANKLPSAISGGQQQRVAIARALANDPSIIIADEPTGSLDSKTAELIFEIFEDLVKKGKTILMVTHDNSLAPRFTRRIMIADGQLVTEDAINVNILRN